MHPGRTARLLVDGAEAGFAGELHPLVRAAFDLPDTPVAVMELDLDALLAPWGAAMPMTELSAQPAVYEDLALIVDEEMPAVQVAELIRQSAGKLLKDARLFDVYRGEPVPAGEKEPGLRAHLPGARSHPDRRGHQEAAREGRGAAGTGAGGHIEGVTRRRGDGETGGPGDTETSHSLSP